jgi:hypothetical protein
MYFAGQLGVCWAELGPHYDSPNEAVIPAVAIVARANCARSAGEIRDIDALPRAGVCREKRALAAAAVWRDHEATMTKEAPHGYRRK